MSETAYIVPPRETGDGRITYVVPLFGGRARICVGTDLQTYLDGW